MVCSYVPMERSCVPCKIMSRICAAPEGAYVIFGWFSTKISLLAGLAEIQVEADKAVHAPSPKAAPGARVIKIPNPDRHG